MNKYYCCNECQDEVDAPICTTCNGSGEGQYDGTTCLDCNGDGLDLSLDEQDIICDECENA